MPTGFPSAEYNGYYVAFLTKIINNTNFVFMGIFKKIHQKIIEYRWKKFVEENKDAASKYICGSYTEPSLKKKYKRTGISAIMFPSMEDVLQNRDLILGNYELEKTYQKVCDLVENYPYGTAVICRDKFRLCFIDVDRMPGQVISEYSKSKGVKPVEVFGEGLPVVGIDDFDGKFCEKLLGYRDSIETENQRIKSLLHAEDIKNDFEDSILANEDRRLVFSSFLQQNERSVSDKEYCITNIAELDAYAKQRKQEQEIEKIEEEKTAVGKIHEQERVPLISEESSDLIEKCDIEKTEKEIGAFNKNNQSVSFEQEDLYIKKYPEVIYSWQAREIVNGKPELPKEPIAPVKPRYPDEPDTINPFLIIALIAAVVICIIAYSSYDKNSGEGVMVFDIVLCWVFCIALFVAAKRKEKNSMLRKQYELKVQEFKNAIKEYDEDCEEYVKIKRSYNDVVDEMSSDKYIMKWRQEQVGKWLRNRIKPEFKGLNGDIVKKGRLDDYFANELMLAGYEVVKNVKIPVGNTFYYPDVLVKMENLYIDIEIDEPYSKDNGEPIHYMDDNGDSIDFNRDSYFSELGFEVIRFAEESVALHLKACMEYIDEVVNAIQAGKVVSFYNADIEVKRWNMEEAKEMSKKSYRDSYLSVLNEA